MYAVLSDRSAYDQREERSRDEARFRMMSRRRRERTTVAANEMFAFAFVKSGGAAEILQNPERRFDPLLARFVFNFQEMIGSDHFSHVPHRRAQLFLAQLLRENSEKKIEKRSIGFRENLLRLRGQGIRDVRLPKAWLRARLPDKSVSLQTGEVRPHRVVG